LDENAIHIVPLATQVVDLLLQLKTITGHGRYLFPSLRSLISGDRGISENTVNVALRNMGFTKEQMTAHGFRAMASTILNDHGWSADAIERQLSHVERNAVRGAYNHAEYLDTRREMMQWYADWLDMQKQRSFHDDTSKHNLGSP
jgi:integrase